MLTRALRSGTLAAARRIILLAMPLVTASCAFEGGPYPYPSGYTYHHQAFKSPGGPKVKMDESELLAATPAAALYKAVDDDVSIDRTALDYVGKPRVQAQAQSTPDEFVTRVVE